MLKDRVKETTTTTGTGDITLAGAVSGFQSFNTAFGTGDFFHYAVLDSNGTAWETGQGYLSGATTLVRTRIFDSTNSDNAISLSVGTHTIFCTALASTFGRAAGRIVQINRCAYIL